MKQQKIFTIDSELINELEKIRNKSGLVNELLIDYFNRGGNLTKEQLSTKIRNKEAEVEKLIDEIKLLKELFEDIDNKETKIKELLKDIPLEIIEDFKTFPNMTEEILQTRFREIYSDHYGLTYNKIVTAYKYFKEQTK